MEVKVWRVWQGLRYLMPALFSAGVQTILRMGFQELNRRPKLVISEKTVYRIILYAGYRQKKIA